MGEGKTLSRIAKIRSRSLSNSALSQGERKFALFPLSADGKTFAQAMVKSQSDNGNASEWDVTELDSSYDDNLAYFEKYWKPYLKVIKVCKNMRECGYGSFNCFGALHTVYCAYGQVNNVPGFILSDGTYAYIRPYPYNTYDKIFQLLVVDINGAKNPNVTGKDVFQFSIEDGKLIGLFLDGYNACTKEHIDENPNEYSRACAAKIMADGWKISDDYPW